MGAQPPDRRALMAGLAALGAAAPGLLPSAARAAIIEMGQSASRLQDLPDPDRTTSGYEPPERLTAVLDIYKRMTGAGAGRRRRPYPVRRRHRREPVGDLRRIGRQARSCRWATRSR